MLPAFLLSCSEAGLQGPEPPAPREVLTMIDRAQGWTPVLRCGHGFMLMAECVLQVGMWSWLYLHGTGMDSAARE